MDFWSPIQQSSLANTKIATRQSVYIEPNIDVVEVILNIYPCVFA